MILFERIVALSIFGFLFWQVVIPLWVNLPVFPMFRRQATKEVFRKLDDVRDTLATDQLMQELHELEQRHEANTKKQESE